MLKLREYVENGGTLYRAGEFGQSNTTDAQFWATENPTNPGYAENYGVAFDNIDYILSGTLKPRADFVVRPAPTFGSNPGGNLEVVVNPNDVVGNAFTMMGS